MTGPLELLLALATAASAAVAAPPELAGEPSPPAATVEEEIVVAERGPTTLGETVGAVTVVTRRELERLPAESLASLLDLVPGVFVLFADGDGGLPMVSARGFFGGGEAEYLQLLVDGVPVADSESGLADWQRLRSHDLERVEVLRGPGSALYGDTALGGVVQVFTRHRGMAEHPEGAVSLSAGSFETLAGDLTFRRGVGSLALGLAASALESDGCRAHSASRRGSADLSLHGQGAGGLWTLAVAGESRDREEPGALTLEELARAPSRSDPLFRFDREETERLRASLGFLGDRLPLAARLWAARRQTSALRTLLVAAGLGDRAWRRLDAESLGLTLEADRAGRLAGRDGRVRIGLDAVRDEVDTAYRAVEETGDVGPVVGALVGAIAGRRDRLGLFVTADWLPSPRLRLVAGTRWDRLDDRFGRVGRFGAGSSRREAWSPRLGANLRLGGGDGGEGTPVVLSVLLARAFKAPTLDQLFDPRPFPDFQGGTFRISSPDLEPQRAKSAEVGLSRESDGRRWEAVAYRIEVDDEIDFDPATFRFENIGASLHTGLEAAARWRLGRAVVPWGSYAWTRVRPRAGEDRGRQLKNIPEHRAVLGLASPLPWRLQGSAVWRLTGRRFLDDAERVPLDAFSTIDLRLEREVGRTGRGRLRLDLLNLTDEGHAEVGFVLPDFSGGQVPYAFPGAGFTARLGLDWELGGGEP